MPHRSIKQFREDRAAGQQRLLDCDHLGVKRFLRLDSATYEEGALPGKTKELLGLVGSAVLRCNDCIDYHLEQCVKLGAKKLSRHSTSRWSSAAQFSFRISGTRCSAWMSC